jgi:hypothetical protein
VHLREWHHSDEKVDPCHIYDTKMILDGIKSGIPVETAAGWAVGLVSEKALELGFTDEWKDLWGWRRTKIHRTFD